MNKSKLILNIYERLPARVQKNKHIVAVVQPIAEELLQKTKQDYMRKRWEKALLEKELQNRTAK